jgi:geranylgeranyl diphosphate synthase, type I
MSAQQQTTPIEQRIGWVEQEMEAVLSGRTDSSALYRMLRYHLGWLDEELIPTDAEARVRFGGKKLRGLLCLLACEAAGGDARCAAPAAAAVEFIHNFSLIHDDVEDQDAERRHRPTVWVRWGVAHAVNAGSNMQALVNEAGLRLLTAGVAASRVVAALRCLTRAMLAMTEGQFQDIEFQDSWETDIEDYLAMSSGKTAALMEGATRLGALVATEQVEILDAVAAFGRGFGMAFQARDDYLGIWGERDSTGKPVGGDILKGKRSLPIVFALCQPRAPATLRAALERRDVATVTDMLEALGARDFLSSTVERFTDEALRALDCRELRPAPAELLRQIAREALGRET